MSEIVGKNAAVRTGGNIIVGIKSWTLDITADALDKTDFSDSGHRTYLAGLDGWSGSFEGFPQPGRSSSATIGTTYLGSFFVSATGGECYSGSIIITGQHPSVSVDGVGTISYDFQGSGALGFG